MPPKGPAGTETEDHDVPPFVDLYRAPAEDEAVVVCIAASRVDPDMAKAIRPTPLGTPPPLRTLQFMPPSIDLKI